jgi:uncharacterized membrane protein
MKFIGAKTMYFRTRTKVIAIIIIAFFIAGLLMQLFGIATPNNAY